MSALTVGRALARSDHHVHLGLLTHLEDPAIAGDLVPGAHRLAGLSDSFTVGFPSAETALHTSENGASASSGVSPRKSLVSSVPQPKEVRTRPENRS